MACCRAMVTLILPVLVVTVDGVDTKKVPGCYLRDARYLLTHLDHVTNPIENVFDFLECQMLCSKTAGCGRFVYLPSKLFCYLGAGDQGVVDAKGAVSGPAVCPEEPAACHQLPTAPFPAETPEASQRAWPMNYTPTLLQCWPWNANVQPAYCKSHPPVTLEKSTHARRCQGLQLVDLPEAESCGQNCAGNLLCSSWQERSEGNGGLSCYQGLGEACFGSEGPKVVDAGRLQHGQYRVIAELKGVQLMGLSFGFVAGSQQDQAIKRCRDLCLSLLPCQAWQYSSEAGCYLENSFIQAMPYPPVVQKGSSFAHTAVAGEYLQRLCSGYLSRVRGDAQDEEVKKQAAMMVVYDDMQAAPQKFEGAPVPVVMPTSPPAEEPSHPQEHAAVPVSPSTDAIVPPTLPPATGAAVSATAAAGVAVTPPSPAVTPNPAPQPAMLVPTLAPLKPAAPVATLAPVPTLAPVATVAPVAPAGLPLKPQLLPVASPGALQFRSQGADAQPVAKSGSAAAELQGRHGRRSISDWLVVSMGVFGLVMVCVAAHFLRTKGSSWKGAVSESEMSDQSDQESFLPN